jgi:protein SCO1/2
MSATRPPAQSPAKPRARPRERPRERPLRTLALGALVAALLLAAFVAIAFALLRAWHVGAGGAPGDAALIERIPEPKLQSAPQLAPRPGAALPATLRLRDADGTPVDRASLLAPGRALVLLPAYFRCTTLCGTVAHGALEALADTGLPRGAWRLALVSFDAHDTPADAAALRAVYLRYAQWARPAVYGAAPPDLMLLTDAHAGAGANGNGARTAAYARADAHADAGTDAKDAAAEGSGAALAQAVGFAWRAEDGDGFAHPTGLVVLTPDGRVSRQLPGVRFDAAELRAAIVAATDGRVGTATERLLLVCSRFDPVSGAHGGAVLMALRIAALIGAAMLGAWVWRHRGETRRNAPSPLALSRMREREKVEAPDDHRERRHFFRVHEQGRPERLRRRPCPSRRSRP